MPLTLDQIRRMARYPDIRQEFTAMMVGQLRDNHIQFLFEVMDFKRNPDVDEVNHVYNRYIAPFAPCEVNLSAATVARINTRIAGIRNRAAAVARVGNQGPLAAAQAARAEARHIYPEYADIYDVACNQVLDLITLNMQPSAEFCQNVDAYIRDQHMN